MMNLLPELLIGYFTLSSVAHLTKRSAKILLTNHPPNTSLVSKENKTDTVISKKSKLGEKTDHLADGIREHVRLGSNMSEMVKGKLSLGRKILQVGGVAKIFKQNFSVREGEKLMKTFQCYLSTSSGPMAGLLFISTDKLAFISERAVKTYSSTNGQLVKIHYKVVIPLGKLKRVQEGQNIKKPSIKYIEIVTKDNFDFWFMGFLNHRRTFKCLQQAISLSQN